MTPDSSIESELVWRLGLAEKLGLPNAVRATELRADAVYAGQAGIFRDAPRTTRIIQDGLAISLLHTGRHYADEIDASGMVYHYPKTLRPGTTDAAEIASVKNAMNHQLPVFVISEVGQSQGRRLVRLGWVTAHDDAARVFFVDFDSGEKQWRAQSPTDEGEFQLTEPRSSRSFVGSRKERSARFAYDVFRRYESQCVLTSVRVHEMLDCAHIKPVADGGTDDARNGLLMTASLHRAYDKFLWSIDPESLQLKTRKVGPTLEQMKIPVRSIDHVTRIPHQEALHWHFEMFQRRTPAS